MGGVVLRLLTDSYKPLCRGVGWDAVARAAWPPGSLGKRLLSLRVTGVLTLSGPGTRIPFTGPHRTVVSEHLVCIIPQTPRKTVFAHTLPVANSRYAVGNSIAPLNLNIF